MSDSFKTARPGPAYGDPMTPRFDLIGLVVSDMAASLAFYRRLGLDFPEGSEEQPHVEAGLPGGLRFALDTEDTIRSFHTGWQPPTGDGRIGLAFLCDSPADVDTTYDDLVTAGYNGELKPWDAPWGMRYAVVLDPDGNGVDLFARLTTSTPL